MAILEIVRKNCSHKCTHVFYPPDKIPDSPTEPLERGLLIGHFSFGYERRYFTECDRVVFLREPILRLASQLQYERRYFSQRPESPYYEWFQEILDPFAFLEHARFWYFDNAMVRMVSGIGDHVAFGELEDQHLERATDNLRSFDFVGLQSSFDEDMGRLMRRYGWRGRVQRINAARVRTEVSSAERDRLQPYNTLDEILYERALSVHGHS